MNINKTFGRWLADATRLTRAGSLRDATEVIRSALARASPSMPAAASEADVIDVPAREVPEQPPIARDKAPPGAMLAGHYADGHGARDYKLFVPPAPSGAGRALVLMLHGCTQDPDDFARGTRMNEAALDSGVIVLYPAQPKSANSSGCWNWFKHNHQARGRGEPALLAGMTRQVMAEHAVDPKRVYVAGLSAGGAMAAILGDAYPDLFAAVGVHSGLAAGAARDLPSAFAAMQSGAPTATRSGRAPPTIVFHGDADTTVNPANGSHVAAASAGPDATQTEQRRRINDRDCTLEVFRDSASRVVTERWVVNGAGHAWSGGSALGSFADPSGPDASREMLRFFAEHPLGKPA